MNVIKEVSEALGIRSTPCIMRVYSTLLIVCVVIMAFAVAQSSATTTDTSPPERLLTLALDSFQIVLGAVIGSLSMTAHKQFGGQGHTA